MLRLDSVSKSFDGAVAVAPLDLEVTTGATTVLIGPSGCGKSTILRLMIGLLWPDLGAVVFDGQPLTPANVVAARRRMGYVIQDGGLFPHLTARGNATLMARFAGWPEDRVEARLEELSELTHFPRAGLDRYPVQLSGGQRQRVSLMRALMFEPEVLLLDEPLGALDPMIRADLQADLRGIFRHVGATVVLVTHDIGEAGYFGDDLVLLRAGEVVQRGTLAGLLQDPAEEFVERFITAQRSPLDAAGESW